MKNSLPVIARRQCRRGNPRNGNYMLNFWIAASLSLLAMTAGIQMASAEEGVPPECRILPEHKATNDVTYRPGVDVRGKPVVPADINADPMGITSQTIVVPLTVDLAKRLQNQSIAGLEMEGTLGFLEISPSGRVTYNGQDLTSQVHALCGEKQAGTALETPSQPDRQTPPDTIKSAPVKENNVLTPPAAKPVTPPPVEPAPDPEPGELLEGGEYTE